MKYSDFDYMQLDNALKESLAELEAKRVEIKALKKNENFVELPLAIGDSVFSVSFIFRDVADDKQITGWSDLEVVETKIETLSQRLRESANLLEGRVFRTREEAQKKIDTLLSELDSHPKEPKDFDDRKKRLRDFIKR